MLLVEEFAAALRDVDELAPLARVGGIDRHVVEEHRLLLDAGPDRMADHMAVDDDDIEPAVVVDVHEVGPPADEALADAGDAGAGGVEQEQLALAEVAVERVVLVLVVRD